MAVLALHTNVEERISSFPLPCSRRGSLGPVAAVESCANGETPSGPFGREMMDWLF